MTQNQQPLSKLVRAHLITEDPAHPLNEFEFPLAFGVALPCEAGASHGDLGIRLHDFELTGLGVVAGNTQVNQLTLEWPLLRFTGCCTVTAKPTLEAALDTGGGLMEFGETDIGSGGGPTDPLDPEKKAQMLNQARAERTRLMDSKNGQQLMTEYQEHNEIYNTVFVKSAAARNAWTRDGTTKEMAEHTHIALDDKDTTVTVVNPKKKEKTFGSKKVTYNQNAFVQQLQLVVNTLSMKESGFDPWDENASLDPENKFVKAATAAMNFGKATERTGNAKGKIKSMSGDAVHKNLNTEVKPMPTTSTAELENLMAQGGNGQGGGRARARASIEGWRVLDADDRSLVRRHIYLAAVERAAEQSNHPRNLWTGDAVAEIKGARTVVSINSNSVTDVQVHLPSFEFDIDDSAWTGDAAEIARMRLSELAFVRSFLLDRIETALTDVATRAMSAT